MMHVVVMYKGHVHANPRTWTLGCGNLKDTRTHVRVSSRVASAVTNDIATRMASPTASKSSFACVSPARHLDMRCLKSD